MGVFRAPRVLIDCSGHPLWGLRSESRPHVQTGLFGEVYRMENHSPRAIVSDKTNDSDSKASIYW